MRSTRCGGVVRPGGQGTPHLRGRSFMNLRYVLTNRQSMPISATYAIRSVFCFAYFSAFCVLRIFDPHYVLRIAYCV